MPIARKDSPGVARICHLLPKPPGFPHHSQLSPNLVAGSGGIYSGHEGQACVPELAHLATNLQGSASPELSNRQCFSTHSPPILNLSPNLSPTDLHRNSPAYDLRESTRRRSMQDPHGNLSQQMQHSPHYLSGIIAEDSGRKSESPCRKKRKLSHNVIDLTSSPSPPPAWQPDMTNENWQAARTTRRNSVHQRRVPTDQRSNTPRARRSPQTRQQRRARERNPVQSESPDRRAFQPLDNQVRPAVIPQVQQPPPVVDIDQMAGPNPAVTMATYGLPVPSGSHYMPLCTGAHVPLCTTGPTRSIPGCAMPVPTCATMQHVPMCSLQQIPMTQALHPYLQAHHQGAPHYQSHPMMHQPHLPAQSQFMAAQSHMQAHDDDVQMLGDHHHHRPPPYHHHHHHHHIPASMPRGPPLNPSPPGVYLQEPTVHPNPHDMYNPFGRLRRGSTSRGRWRSSIPPPPPPYPGFLLHFLAMLGSPTVPPYGMNPNNEASEVENYEALLNLAERLGEAKPRGLQKVEIDQLPKYYYNAEGRRSTMDQTSCVVCMCDFENHQKLRVLPCSHEFHAKCVDKWLKANRTCPICRADSSEGVSQSE